MKKALKITAIAIGSLLLLLILLPVVFKGKIKEIVVREGNKMLNAQFDFRTFNLSLIRNFPQATISIGDFYLHGIGDFQQDTLISAGRISATVNLMSLFSERYDISRISLVNAAIKAKVLEDGRANWEIMKPSEEVQEETPTSESPFQIKLRKVTLDGVDVVYEDLAGGLYAALKGLQLALSGDMSADEALLKIKLEVEKLTVRSGGIPFLAGVKTLIDTKIDANFKELKFVLGENTLKLNGIVASLNGMFAMLDDGFDMDLTLNTEKIGFKELLSMVPAVYTNDFKGLKASGDVELVAWLKGKMVGDDLPAFDVSLKVTEGSFRYPSLPKGVDRINIAASAKSPGGPADRAVVDISKFNFTMGENPFSMTLHLTTPVSDPAFVANAKGVLNLGMVKEVYPLEDMELNGVLDANFDLQGRMSYIEKEQYDKLNASGTLGLNDMLLKMKDIPDMNIQKSTLSFSPQYVTLSETTVGIGRSDITADCRLENYIGFALKGTTIKGKLNISSNLLDLNELMGEESTEQAESESVTAFEVPKNIDFEMNTRLKKLLFSNLDLENVAGGVTIRNGKLDMHNLSFNTLGGGVVANGYYSTAADPKSPHLNASFNLDAVSFKQCFATFVTIQKLAPIFEGLTGNFSGKLALDTRLDNELNPIYNTMGGEGSLNTKDLNISGISTFDMIADALKRPDLKNIHVKDLTLHFTITEGRINTKPFDIKVADTNLNLSGSTGIDQTINYMGKVTLPASAGAIGKVTTLDLKIGGTFTSPKVSVDMQGMLQQAVTAVTEEVKERALEEASKLIGIDLTDVQKQRDAMISEAQKAGDKLVEEAKKQADEAMKKAGDNVLKQVAAKKSGDALIKEAEKSSASLVSKATAEGDKLVEKAKQGE